MMKGLLISALMVIGFTNMASAQCAWVLWERVSDSLLHKEKEKWELQKAYPTYKECMEAKEAEVQRTGDMFTDSAKPELKVKVNPGENVILFNSNKSETTLFEYKCFPDTIDPRK